ncbi:MAG: methyltransferase domain-containing protein [Chloroflexi bacterium]|nr:methyltransferase domain-containing protein [Chloroflexota bacterium]
MSLWIWITLTIALIIVVALAYWHLIIAEGAYLGSGVVAYLYDRFARRYDDVKGFNQEDEHHFIARPLRLGLDLVGARRPWLLDVGTGTGRVPRALLADGEFPGHIVAVDRSLGMLQEAVRRLEGDERVSWLWLDASKLPFPDATFDAVSCVEALEFMPDPRGALAEMVRVLRPGGLMLLSNRVGWQARLLPGRTFHRSAFRQMLMDMGMAACEVRRWQVDYDWAFARKAGSALGSGGGECSLAECLLCPRCGARDWSVTSRFWRCNACGRQYGVRSGILLLAD